MGSLSRTSSILKFVDTFGEKIEKEFEYLVGSTIVEMRDKEVSYHVKATVDLKTKHGLENFEVHHRWATQEEDSLGVELEKYTMEEYFEDFLKGQTVKKISVGISDRDDEVYLFAFVKNGDRLEIPLGFDPEFGEISGYASELLTDEEINEFFNKK